MKRGTPEHPKVFDLCERLRCDRPTAVGYLELLWHFTAKYAPQGDIGRYSDRRIEAALDWVPGRWKRDGHLIGALQEAHWIDAHPVHRLVVHDWQDHAEESVRKKLARAGLNFVTRSVEVSRQSPSVGAPLSGQPTPKPLPQPEPDAHAQTSDANVSPRFNEIWERWPLKQQKTAAMRMWSHLVTIENEPRVGACAERYLASDQVARHIVTRFDRWLEQQHSDDWAGDWPKVRDSVRQAAIDREWSELEDGTGQE
jgi:hypothetical protein